ncbi:MAG: hypothetical protein PHO63_00555 [Bacilli bacterium]|nr:hypothetical protein [Bacilli bacterium]MDD4809196.1 hypothetical protein [Bacilli bacterium]
MKLKPLLGLLTLAIISVLLSGCNVKYDLVIDRHNKVSETLKVTIPNEIILADNEDIETFLDNRIKSYKNVATYKDYHYKKKIGKDESYIIMSKIHKDLETYANSQLLNNLFEELVVIENERHTIFKTVGRFYYEYLYGGDPTDPSYYESDKGAPTQQTVDDVEITIKLHNKLIETNADELDEDNNIYTWKITPNDKQKYLYLKYGKEVRYDVVIKDFFMNNIVAIVLVSSIIIIILVIAAILAGKHLLNNRI